ncbi:4'-phosphopantetheinyl transferase family protein [Lysobacter enzymogenes]|uniref:4'-phosphopantetheinyl transferase family protein n=1 Tax=Lysobacter enzymogenes TaxID=69 RepID=UPI001A96B960|nr:4'-phosphopantetheinyl transferase superfamily protein [Lysobacter enzymogenes]QQP97283.1 4'-phosphopantetheinyl transferase superfamily protein [Lysobacter enzymogenes]
MDFLEDESAAPWWPAPGLVQHSAGYALGRYRDELFDRHRIEHPPALREAVPKRRAEFLAGRYCAARVLERLQANTAVGIGRHRAPAWPAPVVGSISHTADRAIAVATRAPGVLGLGVDIEAELDPVTASELRPQVLGGDDERWLEHPRLSPQAALTLMFSAKESLFKALYPSVGEYFGFEAVGVTALDHERQRVGLVLNAPLPGSRWPRGARFSADYCHPAAGLVATLVVAGEAAASF